MILWALKRSARTPVERVKKLYNIHQSFPLPRWNSTWPPLQALQIIMHVWLNSCQQLQWPKRVWEQDSGADSAQAPPASWEVWYLPHLSSPDPSPSAHPSPCHSWLQHAVYPHCGTGKGSTTSVRPVRQKRHNVNQSNTETLNWLDMG